MRSLLVCVSVSLLMSGCAAHRVRVANTVLPPVVLIDGVREALPNDYFRVSFVPAGVTVTSLSRPGALRAFATATELFSPPLKLEDLPSYSGLVNDDKNVLVAMRCRPQKPEMVDAVLATWPNVFRSIQLDVPTDAACEGKPASPVYRQYVLRGHSETLRPLRFPLRWHRRSAMQERSMIATTFRSRSDFNRTMEFFLHLAELDTPSRTRTT